MQPSNISNDIWVTILSYLKDSSNAYMEPVNPDQFIAIMKMSFVNKSLRNLISSNAFWILYNSTEYSSAKYNIYDCNLIFCQIMHKITVLKTYENIQNLCDTKYITSINMGNIFLMVHAYSTLKPHKYILSNKEIVNSYPILNNKFESSFDLICYDLVENEYCILFTGIIGANNDSQITRFYIKKEDQLSFNDKFNTLSDLYENAIDLYSDLSQTSYDHNATLHNNYIYLVIHTFGMDDINFYAINIMTNVKYLINQVKNTYPSGYITCRFTTCRFTK